MSAAMENRAAVFASQPQDVEIYRANTWWPGALLGWRHDADGGCQAWVRTRVGGVEETSWLALDYLRLPEPSRDAQLAGADDAPVLTGTMAAIRAVPEPAGRRTPAREASSELTATMNLVAVRDLPADAGAPAVAERPARSGGRRRAPEASTGELPAVDPGGLPVPPGRHRAPAPTAGAAGRHRAVDTGVWPAVRETDRPQRPELPRPTSSSVPVLDGPDAHLLTRPMRLGDALDGGVPQPRRARDARLSGV